MAKVFVSYSRKDIVFAKQLTAELQKSEMDFWIDWEGIPPTVDWWREIEKGIEEADIFVFLISPDSAKSKVCGQEIDTAVRNGKRVIPIVVRDIAREDTPKHLGHLNYIFIREGDDFNAAVNKLITAIQTDYEWAATHRRLQVKALDWERNGKENGFLLRSMDLLDAEQDLATNTSKDPHPTDLQREYVFESRKTTDRQRRITTSIAIGGAAVLALLAVVAGVMAVRATQQSRISRARELAAQAELLIERNFPNSLLLGIEAFRLLPDNIQTRGALLDTFNAYPQLRQFLPSYESGAALSPGGTILAYKSADKIVLWDVDANTAINPPLEGHINGLPSLAFSPDGQTLASSSCREFDSDGYCVQEEVILWNVRNGQRRVQSLTGNDENAPIRSISKLIFSPDGKTLAAASTIAMSPYIILWDLESQQQIGQPFNGNCVAFSPDGKLLVTGDSAGQVIFWDRNTQKPIDPPLTHGLGALVMHLTFSPNGKILASEAGTIILWDVATYQSFSSQPTRYEPSPSSIVFSPDNKMLALGNSNKTITLWDVANSQVISELNGYEYFADIVFGPDSNTLISGGGLDGSVSLWNIDAPKNQRIGHLLTTDSTTTELAFSPNGRMLASGNWDGSINLWDITTLQALGIPFSKDKISVPVTGLAFSPDSKTLASSACSELDFVTCTKGEINLWNVQGPQPRVRRTLTGYEGSVTKMTFSPDGNTLAASSSKEIIIWDLSSTRQPIEIPLGENNLFIQSLSFSSNGKTLYSRNSKAALTMWDAGTGQRIEQPSSQLQEQISIIALSLDGEIIATRSVDKPDEIVLLNVKTHKPIGLPLVEHTTSFSSYAAFSPDGKSLVSSNGNNVILWDVKASKPIGQPLQFANISILMFSSDSKTLALGGSGEVFLLDVDPQSWTKNSCQRAGRNFTPAEWEQYGFTEPFRKTCRQWPLAPATTTTPTP